MAHGVSLLPMLAAGAVLAGAAPVPKEYSAVLRTLGARGDYQDGVLRIELPRHLKVTVDGMRLPAAMGLSGWLAMKNDVMTGELALLEQEVNPVMAALLEHGLAVIGLRNRFLFDQPRVFEIDVAGNGAPGDLAREVKPALELIGHVPRHAGIPAVASPLSNRLLRARLHTAAVARIAGHPGEERGGAYMIVVPGGEAADSRMGLNSWAAFTGTDERAGVSGAIVTRAGELQAVLKALVHGGLDVVAIGRGAFPGALSVDYWGEGPAAELAKAFRAAVEAGGR